VPVFNEANTLKKSLEGLYRELLLLNGVNFEVIVVESNSTDGSREILLELSKVFEFKLFLELEPKGKGRAVRKGLDFASGNWIMIFDADMEYLPSDIHKLISISKNGYYDFIIGSRRDESFRVRNFGQHRVREFAMNVAHVFFSFLISLTVGKTLHDPFSMYKLFRKDLFENVALQSDRFDLDWELVLIAGRLHANFTEVSVSYKSRNFSEGKKIRFFRDPFNWLGAWFKYSFFPIRRRHNL
jgi:glycosyltransferase involved in cell wall biosynthesis